MEAAPLYRQLLKRLHAASWAFPHHVNELRFLLSLPVVDAGDGSIPQHASLLQQTNSAQRSRDERPAAEVFHIDAAQLFTCCRKDLRAAFSPSVTNTNAPVLSSVAAKVIQLRDAMWLRQRLDNVLSPDTSKSLEEALDISLGPKEDDFIPDSCFPNETIPQSASPSQKSGESTSSEVVSRAVGGIRPASIFSAGAIGCQREMFVLRRKEPFMMRTSYLQGCSSLHDVPLHKVANNHAELMRLVQETVPVRVACANEEVELSVEVLPFDPEFTNRDQAQAGYFALSHRQFLAKFSLRAVEGRATQVQIVNSYFARLDLGSNELLEEVGYLHSTDVLIMLQQRDGEAKGSARTVLERPFPILPAQRDFDLAFVSTTDYPSVMKGLLYYRATSSATPGIMMAQPIKVLPFGLVKLDPLSSVQQE